AKHRRGPSRGASCRRTPLPLRSAASVIPRRPEADAGDPWSRMWQWTWILHMHANPPRDRGGLATVVGAAGGAVYGTVSRRSGALPVVVPHARHVTSAGRSPRRRSGHARELDPEQLGGRLPQDAVHRLLRETQAVEQAAVHAHVRERPVGSVHEL